MKVPFQCLHVHGGLLFAARGGNVHSFKLEDGSHLSCWKCPVEKKAGKTTNASKIQENERLVIAVSEDSTPAASQPEQSGPSKRKRSPTPEDVQNGEEAKTTGNENGEAVIEKRVDEKEKGETPAKNQQNGKKNQKREKKQQLFPHRGVISQHADRPLVKLLTATSDGAHIIALTDPDKSIWVFGHDGYGNLKQLTRRIMPKRPCSITITPDNQTILSADKHGDVYSLPLIPSKDWEPPAAEETTSDATLEKTFKSEANELTVHTKRNLMALAHQKRRQTKGTTEMRAEAPTFELKLLLGHVSLLTSITLGHHAGRSYIITADRDEHIRVSLGVPSLAHIIESYCLGHEEFVNKLCIPSSSRSYGAESDHDLFPELLVSGGGDPDLFVWNWREGRLLSRTPLLPLVQEVMGPEVAKLAVSGLYCWGRTRALDNVCTILVICERIPAIFMFALDAQGSLQYRRTIDTDGNPLDIAILTATHAGARLAIAVDSSSAEAGENGLKSSLLKLTYANGDCELSNNFIKDEGLGDDETDMTEEELHRLLYTAEVQRKQESEEDEQQ